MLKIASTLRFQRLVGTLFVQLAGCSTEDEKAPEPDILMGTWTVSESTFSFEADCFVCEDLKEALAAWGWSKEDANAKVKLLESEVKAELVGTITFKSDNTYESTIGGDPDTGVWNRSTLTKVGFET